MTKTTDEAVLGLLRKVADKKAEIAKAKKKPQWRTTCTIGYDQDSPSGRVNIQTVRDSRKIVDFYAFLLQREKHQQLAAAELGLEPNLIWQGAPIEDWKHDLKARAGQLSIDEKQVELDELDARVNKLVSPDQRREMELKELQKVLGED